MVFSCVKEIDNAQVNEDQVTIIVSPQHAKVLLKHWGLAIEKYEEQFGPIPDLGPILEAAQSNQAIAAETGRLEPVFVSPIKVRTTKKPKV